MVDLKKTLAAMAAGTAMLTATPAFADWMRAETPHFVIYADSNEREIERLARKLELFDGAVRSARGVPNIELATENKLTVYFVERVSDIRDQLGRGGGVAGFYNARASGAQAFVPMEAGSGEAESLNADVIFFHEYAHHLMYERLSGPIPAWLSEGWAEFFSTAQVDEGDAEVEIGRAAMHRAQAIRYLPTMPIQEMLSNEYDRRDGRKVASIYAWGWVMTHYLTFDEDRQGQLNAYLAGLAQGVPALEAAEAAFGNLDRLQGQMKSHAERHRIPYVKLPIEPLDDDAIEITELSDGFAAAMPHYMRSQAGVTKEMAEEVVTALRTVARLHHDDAMVFRALAEAEFDVGNYEAAGAAADRAIEIDPQLVDAHLYRAKAAMAMATDEEAPVDEDTRSELFSLARDHIGEARLLAPNDPHPLVLYYESFVEDDGFVPQDAWAGMIRAVQLAPFDRSLRFNVAQFLLNNGKPNDALFLLAPIALDAHGTSLAEMADAIVDKLREGDVDGARTAAAEYREKMEAGPEEAEGDGEDGDSEDGEGDGEALRF
ncbi:DUF1570 domain-containing protein [Sphingomicrobium sediminis]|uniref:DUF1570 domain-containing protein n=1 Tax=Sphingomicrobium sediminis TaxID=2950949 RepID=A0A9X2J1X3_9SPHN|nr:DUF1570 domain-containing protein [Sphingomicrobium sediminis]MCM8556435.1 DUF1570 domain-containing protein [Sphingomicrobium sediminis]